MANVFERLREWFLQPLLGDTYVDKRNDIKNRRNYRNGVQKAPLKSEDDCVIVNFCGLIADRSVSMLFGKDITFDLPGESDSPEQVYIDEVWKANHKQDILKSVASYGTEDGTCYIKLLPDGTADSNGNLIPRLVVLDPASIVMETEQNDCTIVIRYIIAYTTHDPETDKDVAYKQVIERGSRLDEAEGGYILTGWTILDYHSNNYNSWILDDTNVWEYDFPPIVHWKNLPKNGSPYGSPDINDDIINLQDKFNFVVSNTAKIIKYHAHPKTWGRKFGKPNQANWGVDEMVLSDSDTAMLQNLEMQSDLGSSLNFIKFLRQAIFDIARSVDIDSLADKLGALTNFGLRVLYQDALSKVEDKRGLYGEALIQINHILLELAGFKNTDGGEIIWFDVLPVDEVGQINALKTDMDLGLVSKQTASNKRGYEWEDEEQRLADEKVSGDNVGAALLRAFGQGK